MPPVSGPDSDSDDKPGETAGSGRRLAVALQYDMDGDGAPRVVASGRGALAEALLDIAFAQGVKVREDADLAQLLSLVEVGDDIPVEAFLAVAEVLAYVYRANNDPRWAALMTGPADKGQG
ncbi:MAG: flagellar protein FhlB [Alphaproteobacteria bacterium]|nr:flagellar protein FhlB [Alphaproteobacteria bacterium]